jgi:hypothetical protein
MVAPAPPQQAGRQGRQSRERARRIQICYTVPSTTRITSLDWKAANAKITSQRSMDGSQYNNNRAFQSHDAFDGVSEESRREERIQAAATASGPSSMMKPLHLSFPSQLHRMLRESEDKGLDGIVSWLPSGDAFKVHNPNMFVTDIMPRYFTKQTKYKSFQTLLGHWGFRSVRFGTGHCGYKHACFVRDNPSLCHHMSRAPTTKRTRIRGATKSSKSSTENAPSSSKSDSPGNLLDTKEEGVPVQNENALPVDDDSFSSCDGHSREGKDFSFLNGLPGEDLKYVLLGYKMASRCSDPDLLYSCLAHVHERQQEHYVPRS